MRRHHAFVTASPDCYAVPGGEHKDPAEQSSGCNLDADSGRWPWAYLDMDSVQRCEVECLFSLTIQLVTV